PLALADDLECRLSLPARVASGQPVPLRFELRNRGRRALHVLTWNTPLEGWFASYLTVTRDGAEIGYTGPQVKRGEPKLEDYVTIAAGKSARAVVDLAQAYDVVRPGDYRVAFAGQLHDVSADSPGRRERRPLALQCPMAQVKVTPQ